MNAKQSVLQKIKDGTFALLTDDEIAKRLKLGKKESLGLRDILRSLVREGRLLSDSRYRYGTAEQFGAKRGTFSGNERGFGFFIPEDGSGDLFIPRRAVKNALHGDRVLCIPVKGRSDDEGEILSVLSAATPSSSAPLEGKARRAISTPTNGNTTATSSSSPGTTRAAPRRARRS